MAEDGIPAELRRAIERSSGFSLRPVELHNRRQAEAFVRDLAAAGHVATLRAPSGRGWRDLVDRLRTGREPGPIVVYGEAPVAGALAESLAVLNRARDVVVDAHPFLLWWCGSDAFLGGCAAAMPDFWSIRVPTLRLAGQPDPRPDAPLLQPQTERDIHAFAAWLVQEHGARGILEWSDCPDGEWVKRSVDLSDVESLVTELRRLVADPDAVRLFGEAIWRLDRGASAERLAGFAAGFGAFHGWSEIEPWLQGPLLVPRGRRLPRLTCRDAGGAKMALGAGARASRRIVFAPSDLVAHALAASLAMERARDPDRLVVAASIFDGYDDVEDTVLTGPLDLYFHATGPGAEVYLLFDPSAPGEALEDATEGCGGLGQAAVTIFARTDQYAWPLTAWQHLWLAPLDEGASRDLVKAWLPSPSERAALYTMLASIPRKQMILHDLSRLLPLLHGLTRWSGSTHPER